MCFSLVLHLNSSSFPPSVFVQGTSVVKVRAEDGDYGSQRNVTYSVEGESLALFSFSLHVSFSANLTDCFCAVYRVIEKSRFSFHAIFWNQ